MALLVYDLLLGSPSTHVQATTARGAAATFTGTLLISSITYDQQRRILTATAAGKVWRPWQQAPIPPDTPVWVSLGQDRRSLPCTTAWGEEIIDGRQDVLHVTCADVTLPGIILVDESFYPFDSHLVTLLPRICIGAHALAGCSVPDAHVTELTLTSSDRTLTLGPSPVPATVADIFPDSQAIVIRRKLFLRFVAATFGLLAVLFLFAVTRIGKPNEMFKGALGFFGALWGLRSLIVPSSVTVFPTLPDYAIFTMFSVLFLVLFVRWYFSRQEVDRALVTSFDDD